MGAIGSVQTGGNGMRKNREKEHRNPYGERHCDFMEKYERIPHVAEMCWYFGVRPEQLREELKRLLQEEES